MLNGQTKTGKGKTLKILRNWKTPSALLAAGVMGVGLLGSLQNLDVSSANAQSRQIEVNKSFGTAPYSFADLVEKVKPAVVSIHVENGRKKNNRRGQNFRGIPNLPEDHPLNEFFKRFGQGPNQGGGGRGFQPILAQGSGFIISEDGYVVTNNHVIDKGEAISVKLESGETLKAKLIGGDPRTDIALLKIQEKRKFPVVKFAKNQARVGDWVLAVGNPFGFGGTVTAGIVSAKNRDIGTIGSASPYDYLQIDAAINRGNSGGPAFNLKGEVIGVNTAIVSPSGGNVGIAFAIPASLTENVVAQLKRDGSVSRGWLGVVIQTVNEDLAKSLGMKKAQGAIITEVTKGGPASKADIKDDDVIVKVNGKDVKDSRDLARQIAALEPKKPAKITVFRNGAEKEVSVKLGRFPGAAKIARMRQGGGEFGEELDDLGLSLAPASTQPNAGKDGVVITDIDPDSEAIAKGLRRGDVILKVGGEKVDSAEDVIDIIQDARKAGQQFVRLFIKTGKQRRFVALPIKKS